MYFLKTGQIHHTTKPAIVPLVFSYCDIASRRCFRTQIRDSLICLQFIYNRIDQILITAARYVPLTWHQRATNVHTCIHFLNRLLIFLNRFCQLRHCLFVFCSFDIGVPRKCCRHIIKSVIINSSTTMPAIIMLCVASNLPLTSASSTAPRLRFTA